MLIPQQVFMAGLIGLLTTAVFPQKIDRIPWRTLTGHAAGVNAVTFNLDGSQVLSGSDDGSIIAWDKEKGTEMYRLSGHTDRIVALDLGPKGRRVVSAASNRIIIVWSLTSKKQIVSMNPAGKIRDVIFSPDGRHVVVASNDKTAFSLDAIKGIKMKTFRGHTNWVMASDFTPDGKVLATVSPDRSLILWNFDQATQIATFKEHTRAILSVAFSIDGRYLATGSSDNTVILWDANTRK